MIDAIGDLIEGGRVKVYSVDSYDSGSWYREGLSLEERAQQHGRYEDWIVNQVVPFIRADSGATSRSPSRASASAPTTLPTSRSGTPSSSPSRSATAGVYDVSVVAGGERGDAVYFNNPADYVSHLAATTGLAARPGQPASDLRPGLLGGLDGGAGEHRRFAAQLGEKGIRHELDVWGHDVPHDWPAWRAQIAHHLPRFV